MEIRMPKETGWVARLVRPLQARYSDTLDQVYTPECALQVESLSITNLLRQVLERVVPLLALQWAGEQLK
jgi:hypothetical protein